MIRKLHAGIVLLLSIAILLPAGCRKKQDMEDDSAADEPPARGEPAKRTRAEPAKGPNIIFLTIDTLRADRLSCYGYSRNTSPFIDLLASRGFVFQNAYSGSPWTAPSMATLFTGLYPREHGVLHGRVAGRGIDSQEMISRDLITLPVALKNAGYRTYGISANGHLSKNTGFARGFDFFELHWFDKCPVPHITATRLKDELAKPGAFFLWIHYFDPHAPYMARSPWVDVYAKDRAECDKWAGTQMRELRSQLGEIRRNPAAAPALSDLYDSEVSYCDQYIRKLFEEVIPTNGNNLVVITSDHGEEFLDHNAIGHGHTLYEEVVHVPLIFVVPGRTDVPMVIERPVSNKDVFSTILDLAGVRSTRRIPGASLAPWMVRGAAADYGPVYLSLDRGRNWKGVRSGDMKLICTGRELKKCGVYNLSEDPGETRNLERKGTKTGEGLREMLTGWLAAKPVREAPVARQKLDRDQVEKLRSLGYLK